MVEDRLDFTLKYQRIDMEANTNFEFDTQLSNLLDLAEAIESTEPARRVEDLESTPFVKSKKHGLFRRKAKVKAENKRVAPSHSTLFKVQVEENDSFRFTTLHISFEVLMRVIPKGLWDRLEHFITVEQNSKSKPKWTFNAR
nr:hypothetical transcript [Hymenolepis microstoma]